MKKSFIYSSIFILLVLLGVLFFVYSENHTQNGEKYSGKDMEFVYPNTLTLEEKKDEVILSHAVPFVHPDPCDFRGDGEDLQEIRDFHVSLELIENTMDDVIKQKQWDTFEMNVSPGYIDEYSVGNYQGYRVMNGIEGCGYFSYYFPLGEEKTLYLTRAYVTELLPITSEYEKHLALPNIFVPEREEAIFESILSSFKVIR
ncbi:MAG: hypothetical protein V1848_03365 [Candidatus Magasanikbacteria bacterium]